MTHGFQRQPSLQTTPALRPQARNARAGLRVAFTALALLISASACLPINNLGSETSSSTSSSTSTTSSPPSTSGGLGSSNSDGAQGLCRSFDSSNPDRLICKACYQTLLSQRCGTISSSCTSYWTDPAACCSDTTVRNTFATLVNQCIAQTNIYGTTCSASCPTGFVLGPSNCTCIPISSAPTPTMPAGGSTYIDVGQLNWGPPVVSATFNPATVSTDFTSTVNSCSAEIGPIALRVTNRAGTVASLNTVTAVDFSCTLADGTESITTRSGIPRVSNIQPPGAGTQTSTEFRINTDSLLDQFGVYLENFDSGAALGWVLSSGAATLYFPYDPAAPKPYTLLTGGNRALLLYNDGAGDNPTQAQFEMDHFPSGTYDLEFFLVFMDSFDTMSSVAIDYSVNGGSSYTSIGNCSLSGGCTGTSMQAHWITPANNNNGNYGEQASSDAPMRVRINQLALKNGSATTIDLVIRYRLTLGGAAQTRNDQSLAIDNFSLARRENLVMEDLFYPAISPSPSPSPSVLSGVTPLWLPNGIPLTEVDGVGTVAGRFARITDSTDGDPTQSPTLGYKTAACAILKIPSLSAGDYQVDFDLFLFDSWDGLGQPSGATATRDFFWVKVAGDSQFRFLHAFSNTTDEQTYSGAGSCRRAGLSDTNETYCANCKRTSCTSSSYTAVSAPFGVGAGEGASTPPSDDLGFGSDNDSHYRLSVPFTKPASHTSADIELQFCGLTSTTNSLDDESFALNNVRVSTRSGTTAGITIYESSFGVGKTDYWSQKNLIYKDDDWSTTAAFFNAALGFTPADTRWRVTSPLSTDRATDGPAVLFAHSDSMTEDERIYDHVNGGTSLPVNAFSVSAANASSTFTLTGTPAFLPSLIAGLTFAGPELAQTTQISAVTANTITPITVSTATTALVSSSTAYWAYREYLADSASAAGFLDIDMKTTRFSRGLTSFLGPFNQGYRDLYPGLSLTGLSPGDYLLEFDLYVHDTWNDPEDAGDTDSPDRFQVLVNGTLASRVEYASGNLGSGGPTLIGPLLFATVNSVAMGSGNPEKIFRGRVSFRQPGGASPLAGAPPVYISFKDTGLNTSLTSVSWGLDNVAVRSSLASGSAVRCGIHYRFTDSNSNSADYCLRFTPTNICSGSQCSCSANPLNDYLGFFIPISKTGACP